MRKIYFIVFTAFAFIQVFPLQAQPGIDSKLKKLFFGLNIDSCQATIEREIENNKTYKFIYAGDVDSFIVGDSTFYLKSFIPSAYYRLENNEYSLIKCDSTFIQLQPVLSSERNFHGKPDWKSLYGHRVSILMDISDSAMAYQSYWHLVDSLAAYLGREYYSGDFTIDNEVSGNITTLNIDQKNNGYEYKRDFQIEIRRYDKFYEVKVEFEKYTVTSEICP